MGSSTNTTCDSFTSRAELDGLDAARSDRDDLTGEMSMSCIGRVKVDGGIKDDYGIWVYGITESLIRAKISRHSESCASICVEPSLSETCRGACPSVEAQQHWSCTLRQDWLAYPTICYAGIWSTVR